MTRPLHRDFFSHLFGMILAMQGMGAPPCALPHYDESWKRRCDLRDGVKFCLSHPLYIFFGILYGEYFGELGNEFLGLEPLLIDRRSAIIPVLLFSLSVGVMHVTLGLFLGFLSAMRQKIRKEAAFKLLSIVVIFCVVILIVSLFEPFPWLLTRPLIIGILILTPLLLFTGGLLAPLELLKSIGNIVSYARIMAIGLASVLLAFVANRMAGMMGDVVVGIIAAVLLHIINIGARRLLPTIHSMRLHYVEFSVSSWSTGAGDLNRSKRGVNCGE